MKTFKKPRYRLAIYEYSVLFFLLLMLSAAPTLAIKKGEDSSVSAPDGMVLIPGGAFSAGLDKDVGFQECKKYINKCKRFWFAKEEPRHEVFLEPFFMDKYEVTQAEFKRLMGSIPSIEPVFRGPNRPVVNVTWDKAKAYCEKVGKRLPTEAEWEKAAKGGRDTIYPWGNNFENGKANICDTHCITEWKRDEFDDGYKFTSPVGQYPPNGYGLYDMAGNVWEWVADWFGIDYYKNAPGKNPQGPAGGKTRVARGGSWDSKPDMSRTANRYYKYPKERLWDFGFRCVQ